MKLFEATNGYMGESYIRVYIWCENQFQARNLARAAFERHALANPVVKPKVRYFSTIEVTELFDALVSPFVTAPSDSGFDFDGAITEPFKNEV